MPEPRRYPTVAVTAVLLIAISAAAASLIATRDGPNNTPDSAAYRAASEHVADGRGLTVPFQPALDRTTPLAAAEAGDLAFSVQAPGVSLVMAPMVWLGLTSADAARAVNALSLFVAIMLAGWCAWAAVAAMVGPAESARAGDRRRVTAVVTSVGVAAALVAQDVLVRWSVRAVSDTLFLAVSLGAMVAVVRWQERRRRGWLIAAVALAAAASIVRYVGVSAIVAVGLVVLTTLPSGIRARRSWAAAVVVVVSGLLPLMVLLGMHDRPQRGLSWHPPTVTSWRIGAETVAGLLLPGQRSAWMLWVAGVAIVALVGWGVWVSTRGATPGVVVALGWLSACFLLVLVVSVTLVDGAVPLGDRHLLPVVVPILVMAAVGLGSLPTWVRGGTVAVVVALVLTSTVVSWHRVLPGPVTPVLVNDFGPLTGPPAPAATARYLQASDPDVVVASNEPSRVWLTATRSAIEIPQRVWPDSLEPVDDFDARMAELAVLMERPGAMVVVYRVAEFFGPQYPSVPELEATLGVHPVMTFDDAVVLGR